MSGYARSRIFINAAVTGGEPAIIIDKVMPFHAELLQITAKFDSAPVSAGSITLTKVSGVDAAYDVLLDTLDPVALAATDIACSFNWQFQKGDRLRVAYSNPDNRDIGFAVVLREGN